MNPPPRPLLKPFRPLRPGYNVAIAALVSGAISIGLMLVLDGLRSRLLREDVALCRAAGEVRADLATVHLWIEEYTAGDRVAPVEFWRGIRHSLAVLDVMVEGGSDSAGPWRLERVQDAELHRQSEDLRAAVRAAARATLARQQAHQRGEAAGPASASDANYDLAFHDLDLRSRRLQNSAEQHLAARLRRADAAFYAILAAWAVTVAVTSLVLRRTAIHRQRSEAALRERELQLVQAQKIEALGRLAGGLSHDINNHLAAIRSQAELVLRRTTTDDRLHRRMAGIVASVESASALIRQLLAYGRRQPARPEVVNLNRIVGAWRETLAQTLGEGIRLELRLDQALWNVRMDPVQVEQVLVNLVVNAREAMPLGGSLVLSTANASFPEGGPGRPVTVPGDYVALTVRDSGPGIPPAVLGRIFEPFFTTKESLGHSGLGLATVYGIVKQNLGNVWAANAPAGGAEFSVYLPRTRDEESPQPAAGEPTAARGSELILLVEDNPAVRESTAALLESAGYRVRCAGGGEEALALLPALGRVDLLISDVVMPGLRGADVVARARGLLGHLPALFLSASVDDELAPGLPPGAELLAKPYSPEGLFAAVRRALAASGPSSVERGDGP